ncbi:MAG: DUF3089 domain-containing protein [Sphingomicrobium sp.]
MLARRFLGCIAVLTILAVAAAFLFYQYGQRILISQATPKGHFEAPAPTSGPDYAKADSWIAKPGKADDPTLWVPEGAVLALRPTRASLFYVHPTTYLKSDRWNAPLVAGDDIDGRTELFVRSQASAFNEVATIWAPRYRQAAFGAFLLKSEDATKALDFAYADVLEAFDAFITEAPKDRPIILAGHSQGSLHLLRLLADRKKILSGRLVVAYLGGWPVGRSADLPATGLAPCAVPNQTACVMSWQSFKDPANTDLVTDAWVGSTGLTGARRQRDDMICTNPISGKTEGRAAPTENPGTLVPTPDLSSASLQKGLVGARCEQGFLMVDGAIPNLGPFVMPGNNYHVYDYALFWGALRADIARRLDHWGSE